MRGRLRLGVPLAVALMAFVGAMQLCQSLPLRWHDELGGSYRMTSRSPRCPAPRRASTCGRRRRTAARIRRDVRLAGLADRRTRTARCCRRPRRGRSRTSSSTRRPSRTGRCSSSTRPGRRCRSCPGWRRTPVAAVRRDDAALGGEQHQPTGQGGAGPVRLHRLPGDPGAVAAGRTAPGPLPRESCPPARWTVPGPLDRARLATPERGPARCRDRPGPRRAAVRPGGTRTSRGTGCSGRRTPAPSPARPGAGGASSCSPRRPRRARCR